jgi:hypothetical protein
MLCLPASIVPVEVVLAACYLALDKTARPWYHLGDDSP